MRDQRGGDRLRILHKSVVAASAPSPIACELLQLARPSLFRLSGPQATPGPDEAAWTTAA